jgi:glycosyltransferase involved in cell wall biosynthesis
MERWCRDAALLLERKGYAVTVYQKASRPFCYPMSGTAQVVGVPAALGFAGSLAFGRKLERQCDPRDPILFVSQELACTGCFPRSAAVNHGIWWDGDMPVWKRWLNRKLQLRLLNRLMGVVCVDTNYINWCHAEIPGRTTWLEKLRFIPNYADEKLFESLYPHEKKQEELTLLFPRRLVWDLTKLGRGLGLFLRGVEVLLNRGLFLRLLFVGLGDAKEPLMDWARKHRMEKSVEVFELSLDGMPEVYARADVVVIPSTAHEGTSLAAVESLMCGRPTVVTHIGGLPNLVLDGVNGHVADLTPNSLADAILRASQERLLERNSGVRCAIRQAFSKSRWETEVWNFLSQVLKLG